MAGGVTTRAETDHVEVGFDVKQQQKQSQADKTTDRVCSAVSRQCNVGEFMKQNATLVANRICEVCVEGTVDHDEDPATQCAFCPGGTYQEEARDAHI